MRYKAGVSARPPAAERLGAQTRWRPRRRTRMKVRPSHIINRTICYRIVHTGTGCTGPRLPLVRHNPTGRRLLIPTFGHWPSRRHPTCPSKPSVPEPLPTTKSPMPRRATNPSSVSTMLLSFFRMQQYMRRDDRHPTAMRTDLTGAPPSDTAAPQQKRVPKCVPSSPLSFMPPVQSQLSSLSPAPQSQVTKSHRPSYNPSA